MPLDLQALPKDKNKEKLIRVLRQDIMGTSTKSTSQAYIIPTHETQGRRPFFAQ